MAHLFRNFKGSNKAFTNRSTRGWLGVNIFIPTFSHNLPVETRTLCRSCQGLTARIKDTDTNYDPEALDYLQYFLDFKKAYSKVVNDGTVFTYAQLRHHHLQHSLPYPQTPGFLRQYDGRGPRRWL
ncbi:hypothetical protein B0T25DRAFT_568991 [Lasiosphaeria hispida]|uniref:Uncharacterized protein n=1 Tax=Lasiosphaeria hispida TaxID=260671 RepID=A0AAJ0HK21_9PEZI|nr:hypothetical protein B0T25DRAFT_568991 [Lasiosphaeria hispida]